jgi:two-component system, NtrC family, sensor kinase
MKKFDGFDTEVSHKINNQNHIIMLNAPIIRAAWNDIISILNEYSDDLDDFTVAGMPFEQACSIMPELIESIENSSINIKNIIKEYKNINRIEK